MTKTWVLKKNQQTEQKSWSSWHVCGVPWGLGKCIWEFKPLYSPPQAPVATHSSLCITPLQHTLQFTPRNALALDSSQSIHFEWVNTERGREGRRKGSWQCSDVMHWAGRHTNPAGIWTELGSDLTLSFTDKQQQDHKTNTHRHTSKV